MLALHKPGKVKLIVTVEREVPGKEDSPRRRVGEVGGWVKIERKEEKDANKSCRLAKMRWRVRSQLGQLLWYGMVSWPFSIITSIVL